MKTLIHVGCLLPVEGVPRKNAGLLIDRDRLADLGSFNFLQKKYPNVKILDASNLIATPGFVNCHAHLELSSLKGRIGWNGSFVDWVHQILKYKVAWKRGDYQRQIDQGIKELIDSGTTTIGDHSSFGYSWSRLNRFKVRGVSFWEIVMFDPQKSSPVKKRVSTFLKSSNDLVIKGIGIHAPYSVSPDLIHWAGSLQKKMRVPISSHVSELKEELDFIARDNCKNPFYKLLKYRGMWSLSWSAPQKSPIAYFDDLGIKGYLAVHANYPKKDDAEVLYRRKNSVIYCPKSHAYFGHPRWPMTRYKRNKLNIALGTDSLASNDALDMRLEMATVRKKFSSLKDEDILRMATLNGAKALGFGRQTGSLKKGKKADITFFEGPVDRKKALKEIVGNALPVAGVMCNGRWLVTL